MALESKVAKVANFWGMGLATLLVKNWSARSPSDKFHKGRLTIAERVSPGFSGISLCW